jgi:hypothetical protein
MILLVILNHRGFNHPTLGGNLSIPVFDISNYIEQVHYKIGTRLYIENAD